MRMFRNDSKNTRSHFLHLSAQAKAHTCGEIDNALSVRALHLSDIKHDDIAITEWLTNAGGLLSRTLGRIAQPA